MNTFGTASLQFALCDPEEVRSARTQYVRESVPELERVNTFYCPSGRWPSRGWILLPRSEYDQLDKYSTTFQLHISDPSAPDNVGILKNLSIVQAQCVTRGIAADPNALFLIEITDGRGVLSNRWFQFPITQSYNIRAPAYPQTFHPATMNSGTTWTWATMVQDMWDAMGDFLGDWPGFPSGVVPLGTPEGFWFPGVSAWDALCDVLDHLGLTIACDLTQTNPFTLVQPGATDTAFANLQSLYTTHLVDDLEWIDVGAARVPKTITVLFRRRNSVYGTEETVRYDSPQWAMTSFYSVNVTAPSTFSSAVGSHYLWSDFTVRYDHDNNPLAEDVATAAVVASEQVDEYFTMIYSQTLGMMTQTYAGALPFYTGARVDGVCWRHGLYFGTDGSAKLGWQTQIVRRPGPPWPEIWNDK